MLKKIFSKELVNTGRQKEIDLIKAFSILMMIICHCIEEFYDYIGDPFATFIREYENQTMGAQAFMIGMGIGIVYAKTTEPKTHLTRGVSLIIIGQVLNLCRYVIPNGINYLLTGDVYWRKMMFLVFSSDIMQFAGLAFMLIALLKYMRFSELKIFLTAVAMSIVGTLIPSEVETGNYVLNQFLGFFISTRSESYFPLLYWFIFPAFGMLFGNILKHVRDKQKFYLSLFVPTGIITVFYFWLAVSVEQPYFRVLRDLTAFNCMSITDALAQLSCNTCLICVSFYVMKILSERIVSGISFISGNINRFYCVQWVLISIIDGILSLYCIEFGISNRRLLYLTALTVILVTWIVVYLYSGRLVHKWAPFFGKRKTVWYGVVIVASVIICVWAYGAGTPIPNYLNDYLK